MPGLAVLFAVVNAAHSSASVASLINTVASAASLRMACAAMSRPRPRQLYPRLHQCPYPPLRPAAPHQLCLQPHHLCLVPSRLMAHAALLMVASAALLATAAQTSAGVARLTCTVALAARLRMVCAVELHRRLWLPRLLRLLVPHLLPRLLCLLLHQRTPTVAARVVPGLVALFAVANAARSSASAASLINTVASAASLRMACAAMSHPRPRQLYPRLHQLL